MFVFPELHPICTHTSEYHLLCRCSEGYLPADPTEPVLDDPGHPPQDHMSYGIRSSPPTESRAEKGNSSQPKKGLCGCCWL